MMPPKRQRSSSPDVARKKAKSVGKKRGRPRKHQSTASEITNSAQSSVNQHPHGEIDTAKFYVVRAILDETAKQYKIDWEDGSDGEEYVPTWEPKSHVNDLAVASWEEIKAQRRSEIDQDVSVADTSIDKSLAPTSETVKRSRGRPRKHTIVQPGPKRPRGRPRKHHPPLHRSSQQPGIDATLRDDTIRTRDQSSRGRSETRVQEEASTPQPTPESLLEIQDSYSEPRQQRRHPVAVQQSEHNHLDETERLFLSRRRTRSPEVRNTPLLQQVQQEIDVSDFTSSQVISGTQPIPSQPDAAAAKNLTQKHSQYEPERSSSPEEDTGSAIATSSPSVHTYATCQQLPSSAVIPDSQSFNDSLSYAASQNRSIRQFGETSSSQSHDLGANRSQILLVDSQIVLQSSYAQGTQHPDSGAAHGRTTHTQDIEDTPARINRTTSPVEVPVEQNGAPESIASPLSPVVVRSSSSASSPPPTVSPDKLQPQTHNYPEALIYSHSRVHDQQQSQHSAPSHSDLVNQIYNEQAAQRPDLAGFDTLSTITIKDLSSNAPENPVQSDRARSASPVTRTSAPSSPSPLSIDALNRPDNTDNVSSLQLKTQVSLSNHSPIHGTVTRIVDQEELLATGDCEALNRAEQSLFPSVPSSHQGNSLLTAFVQPQVRVSDIVVSSPSASSLFPSAPTEYIGTLGDSAPTFPVIASDFVRTPRPDHIRSSMDKSSPASISRGKGPTTERLAAAKRVASRTSAALIASPKPASAVPARLQSPSIQEREIRSPSMIPAVEAPVVEPPEDYYRSERYETLLPGDEAEDQQHVGEGLIFEPLGCGPKSVDLRSVRAIPINFGEQQRDHYKQTVTYRKDLIHDFTSKICPADSELAEKACTLFAELRKIVLHPDLVNEEAYSQPSQIDPRYKAQWDVDTSAKFSFLKHYLAAAKIYNLHTLLLVQSGRIVNMLRIFLQGNETDFRVAHGADGGSDVSPAVTILTEDCETDGIVTPDLIISLQGDISDRKIAKIQEQLSHTATTIPAVSLVVPRTVEHIERVMPLYASEAERLHVLMGTITSLRSEAGRERDTANAVETAATNLVNFILDPSDWPFDELPDIRLFEPISFSQASTESRVNHSIESPNGRSTKRPLEMDKGRPEGTKKARFDEHLSSGAIGPQAIDASHVSDSVASQQVAAVKALKEEFRRRETEMEAALRKSHEQLFEHVRALEALQYRHEDQRQSLLYAESERDKAIEMAQVATSRVDTLQASVSDLRFERTTLQEQLREAKESLLTHTVPERAEIEALKEAVVTAAAERTKLLNKVKSGDEALDYLRDQYQTASNSAARDSKANAALEVTVAELEAKASGEQSRLRDKSLDNYTRNLSARNRQLELMLSTREELILMKEEEITKLKESGRGRMNTRQSSVPRTPRIGSPLATGATSRQASPAAGKGPHPLRNAR